MKTHHIFSALVILFPFVISSCSSIIYGNVGQSTPLFKEKGEGYLNAGGALSLGDGTEALGIQIQTGLAVSNSVGVTAAFFQFSGDSDDNTNGTFGELSVGKFWKASARNWVPEIYFGTGFGTIRNDGFDNVKFIQPYIQPSTGYRGKNFEFILSSKLSLVHYTQNIYSDKNPLAFEPAFTFRYGWQNFKFQWQTSLSTFQVAADAYITYTWDGISYREYFTSNNFYTGLSLQYRIQPKKKSEP